MVLTANKWKQPLHLTAETVSRVYHSLRCSN